MNAGDAFTASSALISEEYFARIAAALPSLLIAGEEFTASLAAESTDFVRLNHGKVRQPGSVTQCYLEIDLIAGARHARQRISLSGNREDDDDTIARAIGAARTALPLVADDPYLLYARDVHSTRSARRHDLPPAEAIVEDVLAAGDGHDLVGLYAGGPVVRAFANSFGQRNWHEVVSYSLDWSLYHRADKAVKSSLSGFAWDRDALTRRMSEAVTQLGAIALPARTLTPGAYRAYVAPAAMEEIASLLCWGGFSARALATHQSPLARMHDGDAQETLDARVSFTEDTADGVAPQFQAAGFMRPPAVPLIVGGKLRASLVSPATAKEFGLDANGANEGEGPEALDMAEGTLPTRDVLAALDTGLYVGNLWYLNYSDRPACRMTGMTRFATFWVEHGRIVAPANVMRFDDTLYRMLGSKLEALTRETELRLSTDTYRQRSLSSMRLPGALLRELTLTL
jgi:predicted Zn-dependent protease